MQVRKIIVASIHGVGKTALETAEKWNLRRGGLVSKRKIMADRRFAEHHCLKPTETVTSDPVPQNVQASDGTLIFSPAQTRETRSAALHEAQAQEKPWLQIDIDRGHAFRSAHRIRDWIYKNRIRTLFVDGPVEEEFSRPAGDILETVFHLDSIESEAGYRFQSSKAAISRLDKTKPKSIDEAVQLLLDNFSFKEKSRLARSSEKDAAELFFHLGEFIRNELRWWEENPKLMAACLEKSRTAEWKTADASDVIIGRFIRSIQKSHSLRLVAPPEKPTSG
jgi:hypothetical protein